MKRPPLGWITSTLVAACSLALLWFGGGLPGLIVGLGLLVALYGAKVYQDRQR